MWKYLETWEGTKRTRESFDSRNILHDKKFLDTWISEGQLQSDSPISLQQISFFIDRIVIETSNLCSPLIYLKVS